MRPRSTHPASVLRLLLSQVEMMEESPDIYPAQDRLGLQRSFTNALIARELRFINRSLKMIHAALAPQTLGLHLTDLTAKGVAQMIVPPLKLPTNLLLNFKTNPGTAPLTWASSDSAVLGLAPSADTRSCIGTPGGAGGVTTVTVTDGTISDSWTLTFFPVAAVADTLGLNAELAPQ